MIKLLSCTKTEFKIIYGLYPFEASAVAWVCNYLPDVWSVSVSDNDIFVLNFFYVCDLLSLSVTTRSTLYQYYYILLK